MASAVQFLIFKRMADIEERAAGDSDLGSLICASFFAEPAWKREPRSRAQLKTVLRISHHCGFSGTLVVIMMTVAAVVNSMPVIPVI